MQSHQRKTGKGPQCEVSTTILGLESLNLLNPDNLSFDSASKVKVKIAQLCPALCDPWTVAHQSPLSGGFSRQEHWGGPPSPSPGVFLTQGCRRGCADSWASRPDPVRSDREKTRDSGLLVGTTRVRGDPARGPAADLSLPSSPSASPPCSTGWRAPRCSRPHGLATRGPLAWDTVPPPAVFPGLTWFFLTVQCGHCSLGLLGTD